MVKGLSQLHTHLSRDIDVYKARMSQYYGQEGKVYLVARNIRTKRPSRKSDHQKVGPFIIDRKLGPVNYKLRLPQSMSRIHPVFHVALHEKAANDTQAADDIEVYYDDDREYEVETILEMRRLSGRPHYLVKWKRYPDSENT